MSRVKAIAAFRETEKLTWNANNANVIQKVRKFVFPPEEKLLEHVHVLDLAAHGEIRPHIDAVKFCGRVIGGLSLLSDCVMRLRHEQRPELEIDVLLRRRSLYIMQDVARYEFTHAVLPTESSMFAGKRVEKGRRISVIFRCLPDLDVTQS